MPIQFDIDQKRNLSVYTLNGQVSVEDVKSVVASFEDSLVVTKNLLLDTRPATFPTPLEREDLEQLVSLMETYRELMKTRKGIKSAVIAETDLGFAIMRMFNSMAQFEGLPITLKPFRTMEDALEYFEEQDGR